MARSRFSVVYSRVWSNPEFRARSADGRDAWLYLLTCPHRNTEGMFRLPVPVAAYDLQWDPERTSTAFAELESAGFIAIDPATDVVWLVNAITWNAPKGPKQVKGAVNALADVPSSPALQARYLDKCRSACPELAEAIDTHLKWDRYPIDTPSEGLGYPSDSSYSFSSSFSASTPPSPPPVDTVEPGAAEGRRWVAEDAEVVALGDRLVALDYADPEPAKIDERRYIARALNRGWTIDQLEDLAAEAMSRDHVGEPRDYLRGGLKKRANSDPDGAPQPEAPPATGWRADWAAVQALVKRYGSEWIQHPDGLTPRALMAANAVRQTIRYESETAAEIAFRQAWAAVQVPA